MPAGLIDEGEDAAQAAVRELKEETGVGLAPSCLQLKRTPMHCPTKLLFFVSAQALILFCHRQCNQDGKDGHWLPP
jgi:8-oxo-dGTP pyrophosphatase MutT (NUDIX family)